MPSQNGTEFTTNYPPTAPTLTTKCGLGKLGDGWVADPTDPNNNTCFYFSLSGSVVLSFLCHFQIYQQPHQIQSIITVFASFLPKWFSLIIISIFFMFWFLSRKKELDQCPEQVFNFGRITSIHSRYKDQWVYCYQHWPQWCLDRLQHDLCWRLWMVRWDWCWISKMGTRT